jgi:poly(3-hydroxybutyrate) depolymerase
VGMGRRLDLGDITAPTCLLVGDRDDITPPAQVLAAERKLGTPERDIKRVTAKGGHIGLFMGSGPIREQWPGIVDWIVKRGG